MAFDKGFGGDFLSELKRKCDIVSIASNYVQLQQKGGRFWACCPFHSEKTPSFTVSEEGFYYCFGCKESGDVIKFVQKMENLDFMDAVKFLADKAGLQVPAFEGKIEIDQNKKLKNRVLLALDYAYKHYMENLYSPDAKRAQEYIKSRFLTRRVLEDFKIGYSKNWTDIVTYLSGKGFSEEELLASGICAKKDGRLYDFVAERLVFPIFDSFGACIGFSARALEKTDFAKYKNTAETIVFQKGRVVFGINILKAQKQQQLLDKIVLVEGQMDVIAMHKAGFKNTVACMGTALTSDHVRELKRYCPNICLCFDADGAGTKATLRAIEMMRGQDIDLRVVRLQGGKDPDEVLNNVGKERLQQMIDDAMPYMDFLIEHYKGQFNLDEAEQKNKFVKVILAEIKKLGSPSAFEPYLEKVRDITKIPLDVLRRDILDEKQIQPQVAQAKAPVVPTESGDEKAAKFILASLLHRCEFVDKRLDYAKLLEEFGKYLSIIQQIEQNNLPLSAVFDEDGADTDQFLMELLNFNFTQFSGDEVRYFAECVWKVAEQKLKAKQNQLSSAYRACENLDQRAEIAKQLGQIATQLRQKSLEEFYVRR